MRGHFSTSVLTDYAAAETRGIRDGTALEVTVTVSSDNLDDMLKNPPHQARIDGTIACPPLSPTPLHVADGVFKLLVADPARVTPRQLTYRMIPAAHRA